MEYDADTINKFLMRYSVTITEYETDNVPISMQSGGTYAFRGLGGIVKIEMNPSNLERMVNDSEIAAKKQLLEWDELVLRDKFPAVKDAYEKYQAMLALTRDAK